MEAFGEAQRLNPKLFTVTIEAGPAEDIDDAAKYLDPRNAQTPANKLANQADDAAVQSAIKSEVAKLRACNPKLSFTDAWNELTRSRPDLFQESDRGDKVAKPDQGPKTRGDSQVGEGDKKKPLVDVDGRGTPESKIGDIAGKVKSGAVRIEWPTSARRVEAECVDSLGQVW